MKKIILFILILIGFSSCGDIEFATIPNYQPIMYRYYEPIVLQPPMPRPAPIIRRPVSGPPHGANSFHSGRSQGQVLRGRR